MIRLVAMCLVLACLCATHATAQTRFSTVAESRVTVTGFAAYGFAYDRTQRVDSAGTSRREVNVVPASEVYGGLIRYRIAPRFALEVGVQRRGQVIELLDCDVDGDGICRDGLSRTHPALLIAKAGLAWSAAGRVPLVVSIGPAAVRERGGSHQHWAVAAGAGLELPLPVAGVRAALSLGMDTHHVAWRGVQRGPDVRTDPESSRVTMVRAGLTFGL